MKYFIVSLMLVGGFVSSGSMEASAAVRCADGVYRSSCVVTSGVAPVARAVARPRVGNHNGGVNRVGRRR